MRLDHHRPGVRTRWSQSAWLIAVALGLSACTSMTGIQSQATLRDASSLGLPVTPGGPVDINTQWWREFGDAQLNGLIDAALATNPSLKIVQARLARAQAGVDVTDAASGPQLNAGIDATRQLFTGNGMIPPPY